MEHDNHHIESSEERRKTLEDMLRKASAFRKNPREWWENHRVDLLLQGPATYAVECVDEGDDLDKFLPRSGHHLPENFDVISVPGSGVTYPGFAADLRKVSQESRVMGVTSHKDCGACKGDDRLARAHAEGVAAELEVPYLGHVEELQRPAFHIALGANLRYTKRVRNIRFAADGPRYFDASQWCLSDRTARIANIRLMLNIAYHHGFNDLFLEQHVPFELVIWYDPQNPEFTKDTAADEVQEAFKQADLPPELRRTKGLLKLTFVEVV